MQKDNVKAYIAWITICIVWGTTYLAIRIGVDTLPPMLFAGLRWILAGIIFLSYLKFKKINLPPKKEIIHLAIPGILMIGFANGFVVVAEQWVPSGLAALLITTLPFWVVGMESALPLGIKINLKILLGMVLGLAGVLVILGNELQNLFNSNYLIGVFLLLGTVVTWAMGTLYSKHKKLNVHPLMGSAVQMLIAGSLQTLVGIILGELPDFVLTQSGLLSILYLTIFGSILGYGSYIYALAHLPVSLVSTYAYVNPIIALFLGWLILDEQINPLIILAAFIILIGVVMVQKGSTQEKLRQLKNNIPLADRSN